MLLIRCSVDDPKLTRPHLATAQEMEAFRSNPSPISDDEFLAKALEMRRLRVEEEARLSQQKAGAKSLIVSFDAAKWTLPNNVLGDSARRP